MDGRGGCCIARYAAGGNYDMSKLDRIMLRFRPIAPKPAAGRSGSGGSSPENGEVYVKSGRTKRRYVRNSGKRCNSRKRKSSSEETNPVQKTSSDGSNSGVDSVLTLPLLPETPDRKHSPARVSPSDYSDVTSAKKQAASKPIWLTFNKNNNRSYSLYDVGKSLDRTLEMVPQPVMPMGSTVTVECVTDSWNDDGYGLGCTDEERIWSLERDTCPGFVSDGLDRVVWTNRAYREMTREGIESRAFTCRARMEYTCGRRRGLMTLPCDVWRMEGGRFAWRLDVKAALSLGR
ncbi:hypothetical protein NMG60_11002858 [Bertholletia excelsa]